MNYTYSPKICELCKRPTPITSGAQRYCLECGAKHKKYSRNEWHRQWYYYNKKEEAKRKAIWYKENKVDIYARQKQRRLLKQALYGARDI